MDGHVIPEDFDEDASDLDSSVNGDVTIDEKSLNIQSIYGFDRKTIALSESTENCLRSMYPRWIKYATFVLKETPPIAVREKDNAGFCPNDTGRIGLGLYPDHKLVTRTDYLCFSITRINNFLEFVGKDCPLKTIVQKACSFLNFHLKAEYMCIMEGKHNEVLGYHCPTISISKIASVKNTKSTMKKNNAKRARDEMIDFQQDVDNTLSPETIRQLILCVFDEVKLEKETVLTCVQFGASFNQTMADLRRGDEHYKQNIVQRFTREIKSIGPVTGTTCSVIVTNEAKHNQDGRLEYTATAPHLDPLRDTCAMHGLLWIVRFHCMNEDFPDFLDYEKLFKVPTYRKKNAVGHLEGSDFHAQWKKFFDACGTNVSKVTHQPRKQGQMELYDANVDVSKIAHMAGYAPSGNSESVKQQRCYLTNPPVACIVQRAGGDPMKTRAHWAGWSTVPVPEQMITELFPDLMEKKRIVMGEFDLAGTTAKRADARLFTARGTVLAIIHDIEQAMRMLASRMVCPTTYRVDRNFDQCIRDMYHGNRLYEILDHNVFKGEHFRELKSKVYEAQMRSEGILTGQEDNVVRNQTEAMIRDDIDPKFDTIQKSIDSLAMVVQNLSTVVQQMNTKINQLEAVGNKRDGDAGVAATNEKRKEYVEGIQQRQHNMNVSCRDTGLVGNVRITKTGREVRRGVSLNAQRKAMWMRNGIISETLDDSHCVCLDDYWKMYKRKWGKLELTEGNSWRKDICVYTSNGKVQKNAAQQWWSRRNQFYKFMLEKTEQFGEERALELANQLYKNANGSSKVKISLLERTFRDKSNVKRKPTGADLERRNTIIRKVIANEQT